MYCNSTVFGSPQCKTAATSSKQYPARPLPANTENGPQFSEARHNEFPPTATVPTSLCESFLMMVAPASLEQMQEGGSCYLSPASCLKNVLLASPENSRALDTDEIHHQLFSLQFFSFCLFTPDHALGQLLSWLHFSSLDAYFLDAYFLLFSSTHPLFSRSVVSNLVVSNETSWYNFEQF